MSDAVAIGVMIVTQHPIMRDGLRLRVRREADMYVACEVADLKQALRDFQSCKPDVVVIDLQTPAGAALEALWAIRALSPRIPLVLFSDFPEEFRNRAFPGQAATVAVPKIAGGDGLISAIRTSLEQGLVLDKT